MIRNFNIDDLVNVNEFLKEFDVKYDENILENPYINIILYEIDGNLIGILVYDLIYDRIEIEYIKVEKKYRCNGLATFLLNHMEKINKVKNITLEVKKSNTSAINFYKKNGYEEVSIRKNYYKDEDGILMIKKWGE